MKCCGDCKYFDVDPLWIDRGTCEMKPIGTVLKWDKACIYFKEKEEAEK